MYLAAEPLPGCAEIPGVIGGVYAYGGRCTFIISDAAAVATSSAWQLISARSECEAAAIVVSGGDAHYCLTTPSADLLEPNKTSGLGCIKGRERGDNRPVCLERSGPQARHFRPGENNGFLAVVYPFHRRPCGLLICGDRTDRRRCRRRRWHHVPCVGAVFPVCAVLYDDTHIGSGDVLASGISCPGVGLIKRV